MQLSAVRFGACSPKMMKAFDQAKQDELKVTLMKVPYRSLLESIEVFDKAGTRYDKELSLYVSVLRERLQVETDRQTLQRAHGLLENSAWKVPDDIAQTVKDKLYPADSSASSPATKAPHVPFRHPGEYR